MWSSSGGEDQNNDNTINNNGLVSRSSSSSTSPFSPLPFNAKSKTMEEVWKDINLSSLHHDPPSQGHTFQDFLARPFSNDPPNSTVSATFASPAPPPATMLILNANEKKRSPEFDRRKKRMIKNRESAARSRARKQAYTNELELEVAQLTEENARLKKHQHQLCMAAAAQQPKKYKLSRTTTAPF